MRVMRVCRVQVMVCLDVEASRSSSWKSRGDRKRWGLSQADGKIRVGAMVVVCCRFRAGRL